MGLYISKLSIQALAVSHIVMHCLAFSQSMDPVDASGLISENTLDGINLISASDGKVLLGDPHGVQQTIIHDF
ncbi:hypothetical protein DSO57_1017861 [Entomophthora muscae]|uniref:Uncharacterized protein n=1 Tax=Entomophthora muscae TaxID=34485 RepID=A0ACC2STI5_9FUNG|nr:hypothetical protein DSO57_1017861 [Entomophthora muscae]